MPSVICVPGSLLRVTDLSPSSDHFFLVNTLHGCCNHCQKIVLLNDITRIVVLNLEWEPLLLLSSEVMPESWYWMFDFDFSCSLVFVFNFFFFGKSVCNWHYSKHWAGTLVEISVSLVSWENYPFKSCCLSWIEILSTTEIPPIRKLKLTQTKL